MPWLWEAWDKGEIDHTPSPWTAMTGNAVELLDEHPEHYSQVLAEELMSNDTVVYLLPLPSARPDPVRLCRGGMNWHQVYTQIKYNWGRLNGLRNRKRIWEDVEGVTWRIQKYERQ